MAHEITATDRMVYVGNKPWHDVGIALATPPASVGEALQVAALDDWGLYLDRLKTSDGRHMDRYAVIRTRDNTIIGDVGPDYHVVTNEKAFSPLEPIIAAGLATVETAGSLKGGARVWMLLKVNRPDVRIVGDDVVRKYILVAQGHDGSLGWHFGDTAIRAVCDNTLTASIGTDGKGMLRFRHTRNVGDAIDAATTMIGQLDARFERAAEIWRYMASIKITEKQLRAYVDAVFPAPKTKVIAPPSVLDASGIDGAAELSALLARPAAPRESTLGADTGATTAETNRRIYMEIAELFYGKAAGSDLPSANGTAFGAYNAVTDYLSHRRGHNGEGQAAENRANNLWFGDIGARAANQALKVLTP